MRRSCTPSLLLFSLIVACGQEESTSSPEPAFEEMPGVPQDMTYAQDMPARPDSGSPRDLGQVPDAALDMRVDMPIDMPASPPDLAPDALRAVDDIVHVRQGELVVLDLLANDEAPASGTLTLVEVSQPGQGTLEQQGNSVMFEAAEHFNGLQVLDYTISDGADERATARVLLNTFESFADGAPSVVLPDVPGLGAEHIAVVINTSDAYSVAVGEHYAMQRGIPSEHVIRVSFDGSEDVMSPEDYALLDVEISAQIDESVQGFVLSWLKPYRVACMSMTSAFALGFDRKYCKQEGGGCQPSEPVSYYGSYSTQPLQDHGLRPAMMLALTSEADGFALVDRGVSSDGTFPTEKGYLWRTTDSNRSVRYTDFVNLPMRWGFEQGLDLDYVDNEQGMGENTLRDTDDVLFYFTGLARVGDIETNTYVPGAVADHLTSFGGRLSATSGQMSAVRWLEAGATASFGTVVEPCNYQQKFPRVSTLLDHYYRGETVLESYWKSVQWPGEGVFIGDPLARPWGRAFLNHTSEGTLSIGLTWLEPGKTYHIEAADSLDGPWEVVGDPVNVPWVTWTTIEVPGATRDYYRLVLVDP